MVTSRRVHPLIGILFNQDRMTSSSLPSEGQSRLSRLIEHKSLEIFSLTYLTFQQAGVNRGDKTFLPTVSCACPFYLDRVWTLSQRCQTTLC